MIIFQRALPRLWTGCRKFFLGLLSLVLSLVTLLILLLGFLEWKLPNVEALKTVHWQTPVKVYSQDGLLMAEFGHKKRIPVSIEEIPKPLIDAFVSTEDQRFFKHYGFDIRGLARAVSKLISTGSKAQGGSTITMQVARNFYLSPEKTYIRKLRELLLAIKIERTLTKDKILELYLNKIFLGHRSYGIAAAAKTYYGKSLSELTLAQMAMLAGLPKAPSRLNPLTNPKAALTRRNHVLERMAEEGYISEATKVKTQAIPVSATYHERKIQLSAPYVSDMVREYLLNHYGERVFTSGLQVFTTIHSETQQQAQRTLREGLQAYHERHHATNTSPVDVQGTLIAMKPSNGAILALVGGFDYTRSQFNRATKALRQAGSSFKPFIYAAALHQGYTLATLVNDAPFAINDTGDGQLWRPENANHRYHGPTRLKEGLVHSRNLLTIRLLDQLGIPNTLAFLSKFGFEANKMPHTLSLALGAANVSALELSRAYAILANGGYKIQPFFISHILNGRGEMAYQASPLTACHPNLCAVNEISAESVLDPAVAYLMQHALADVITQGTARAAKQLHRHDIAGKTGTTDDQFDAWFAGFTPNVVATVWVGFDKPQSLGEYGSQAALPIWIHFMKEVLANEPDQLPPPPLGLVTLRIDPKTGLLTHEEQPGIYEVFREENAPDEYTNPTADEETQEQHSDNEELNIF